MAYVSLDTEQVKRANKKHKYTKEQVIQLEKSMDEKTGPLYFMKTFMKASKHNRVDHYPISKSARVQRLVDVPLG